jgi:hypothetical protein
MPLRLTIQVEKREQMKPMLHHAGLNGLWQSISETKWQEAESKMDAGLKHYFRFSYGELRFYLTEYLLAFW